MNSKAKSMAQKMTQAAAQLYDVNQIAKQAQQQLSPQNEIKNALSQHPLIREVAVVAETAGEYVAYIAVDPRHSAVVDQKVRYKLPNNMAIVQNNRYESDYMYQEIFEEQVYLRHGITLKDGDCVFDVGANIGLFTLYIQQLFPETKIYAFEPAPPIFELLKINTGFYGKQVKLLPFGLSDSAKQAVFTFYPSLSISSGYYTNAVVDLENIKSDFEKRLSHTVTESQNIDQLLQNSMNAQTFETQLRTISETIREQQIERIDLLKLDVENSELDVLAGILTEDWQKIQQIVIEMHDDASGERMAQVQRLLGKHGFTIEIDQESALIGSHDYLLYARRTVENAPAQASLPKITRLEDHVLTADDLHQFLKNDAVSFVFLDQLPHSLDGQVDVQALTASSAAESKKRGGFTEPRTPTEKQLAQIWAEALAVDRVGIDQDFFTLGGHSIMATQILFKVHETFQVEIPMAVLFSGTFTVATLAKVIDEQLIQAVENDELAHMLDDLDGLSDDEIRALLDEELK